MRKGAQTACFAGLLHLFLIGLAALASARAATGAPARAATEPPARAASGAPALARTDAKAPISVLLVTIDTLRADRLFGERGASAARMPHLAKLAGRGVLFRRAVSQTPLTVPSHVTIFTGLDPRHHGVRDNNGYALAPSTPTLMTMLCGRGLHCAAFVGGAPLARRPDLARGFEVYDDRMTRAAGGGGGPLTERRADEVVTAALSWFKGLDPKARFFAWVHFYDPHDPYEAPAGARRPGDSPYDGEVRYADAALGRLVESLELSGRLARTLIVVVGDHGEMLGEHGEATHGIFLYQGALAVPLVVVLPAGVRGTSSDRTTPLSDILPTILDLLGSAAAPRSDGESAAGEIRTVATGTAGIVGTERRAGAVGPGGAAVAADTPGAPVAGTPAGAAVAASPAGEAVASSPAGAAAASSPAGAAAASSPAGAAAASSPADAGGGNERGTRGSSASALAGSHTIKGQGRPTARVFYLETIHPRRRYGWSPLYGLVEWPMKFIDAPDPELYDLSEDPAEARNLLKSGKAGPWNSKLARLRAESTAERAELVDEDRLAALRSLGYVGSLSGATARDTLEDRPRRDPKQGVRILPMLQSGLAGLNAGDGSGAAKALDQALAIEPDSVLALHNRGIAAMMQDNAKEAETWFRKAAASDPQSDNVFCDLGVALTRQERPREAEAAYRRALEINPEFVMARFNLAVLMLGEGRKAEAKEELRRVRAAAPDFPHLAEALKELDASGDGGGPGPKGPGGAAAR